MAEQNAEALGTEYTLWQQQQWTPGKGPSPMENRGSPTENHMDHVHAMVRQASVGTPNLNNLYPSAGMPTPAAPYGVSADGIPLGTENSPYYVMPAQGSSGGEQLGQDFVSGILEVFGFDGSVFKNPLDNGLFKGFKGLMSFFTGRNQQQGSTGFVSPGAYRAQSTVLRIRSAAISDTGSAL